MENVAHPPRVMQFLNYLQFERHFSAYTSRCYGADLRQFCQFLLGIPAEIMPDDVEPALNGNGNGHAENGNGGERHDDEVRPDDVSGDNIQPE